MILRYPPEIIKLKKQIAPYEAQSAEEDRGDGFVVNTPDYILEYEKKVLDFVRKASTGTRGELLI